MDENYNRCELLFSHQWMKTSFIGNEEVVFWLPSSEKNCQTLEGAQRVAHVMGGKGIFIIKTGQGTVPIIRLFILNFLKVLHASFTIINTTSMDFDLNLLMICCLAC